VLQTFIVEFVGDEALSRRGLVGGEALYLSPIIGGSLTDRGQLICIYRMWHEHRQIVRRIYGAVTLATRATSRSQGRSPARLASDAPVCPCGLPPSHRRCCARSVLNDPALLGGFTVVSAGTDGPDTVCPDAQVCQGARLCAPTLSAQGCTSFKWHEPSFKASITMVLSP